MNKFIAVQMGARRNYAVPSLLEEAGMLEAFYTDLCANAGLGAVASQLFLNWLKGNLINNLLGRQLPPNLLNKTYSSAIPSLLYFLRKQLAGHHPDRAARAMGKFNTEFGNDLIAHGIGEATHLYTMLGEGTPFLRFAKEKGLTTVTEFFIILNAHYIVKSERERLPEFEPEPNESLVEEAFSWLREVCSLTDWGIAPSEAVRQDLVLNFGIPAHRCFVVPYAVSYSWFHLENTPRKGQILFVGTAGLRKGIHILGMAAQKLNHRKYEFRVAGDVSEIVRRNSLTHNLNFLGRVPRTEIKQEYAQADIFVLPSLAEGSAEVTYEALAAGIPVITTEAAGSVVRDGIDGFIVPERDAGALAERIEELVENRELRHRMAAAARERAKDYTWDKYAERLLAVFQSV
ncbi:glycosyltransferase family 4 protein [Kamptonema formosum]|uniref:glycosyltransferase family 4 protein n=1 Tax=Kamptonema formosum TaxID=331992 RepID=UPI000345F6E0|nr:glycosyltransferase family 4 protein [Oscillatoria sp. PCC 10802]